jgi:hypothetical protein
MCKQPAERVKTNTSHFRSLDRASILIEEVFRKKINKETYICKPVVKEWGVIKYEN